jgi:hypothetical protein
LATVEGVDEVAGGGEAAITSLVKRGRAMVGKTTPGASFQLWVPITLRIVLAAAVLDRECLVLCVRD